MYNNATIRFLNLLPSYFGKGISRLVSRFMQNLTWSRFILLHITLCNISIWLAKRALRQIEYRIEAATRYTRQNGNFRSIRTVDQCVHAWVLIASKPRYIRTLFRDASWRNSFCRKLSARFCPRAGLSERARKDGSGKKKRERNFYIESRCLFSASDHAATVICARSVKVTPS